MLRVTVEYFDSNITLKVEGELNGSGVEELERCWLLISCTAPNKRLRVELDGTCFIAQEGRELIGRMAAAGAELIASGPMVKAIVGESREANQSTTQSVA
jgi:hypothetical protein